MSTHPHIAYELARARQEDVRRDALRRQPRQMNERRRQGPFRRRPTWPFKAPLGTHDDDIAQLAVRRVHTE
ncbi:MAG TPA: hypothetical protein VFH56_07945 [Acidimicrobiales bacterium]|nr:hypothetical protein [Acidimicrobiales bacterium]